MAALARDVPRPRPWCRRHLVEGSQDRMLALATASLALTTPPRVSTAANAVGTPRRSRRDALGLAAGAAAAAALPQSAFAADESTVKVYFGAGCFWHVQQCVGAAQPTARIATS